jgi:hypothetical protein
MVYMYKHRYLVCETDNLRISLYVLVVVVPWFRSRTPADTTNTQK